MKKYLTPLNITFGLEIIVVTLAATGLIPREAILIWTGLAIFYMIFAPVKDSLWLAIASIPLTAALPISENFDTMANWRLLVVALFLVWLAKEIKNYYSGVNKISDIKLSHLAVAAGIFLLVGALSIGVAEHKILALKKLLFLINIFMMFAVARSIMSDRESILRVWLAAATGAATVVLIAVIQLFSVWFAPLIDFWQFWSGRVINFFYGQNLAELLSYANTWFAYYEAAPPTLRLFSVFPDAHSFAMFSLLSVPIFLVLSLYFKQRRRVFWALAGLALFGAVFSGSRGVWLSALPVAVAAGYLYFRSSEKTAPKQVIFSLLIFAGIFLVSTFYPPVFYKIQEWQTGQYSSSTISFFERARSISDLDETSNRGRLEIWRASVHSIVQRPWLGVGLGNFVTVINESTDAVKRGASAHNLYLDVAAETGLPGLLVLLLMFLDALRTSWLVWQRGNESYIKLFGLSFGLYFFWIIGYSFFDVVLLNDKVLLFLMVGLATLYSLKNIIVDPKIIWGR